MSIIKYNKTILLDAELIKYIINIELFFIFAFSILKHKIYKIFVF